MGAKIRAESARKRAAEAARETDRAADPRGGLTTAELHLSTRRFCSDKRDQLRQ
jgi:hypothetical protein